MTSLAVVDENRGEFESRLTDPDSAKMTSSRGVLQGYNGLAVVDDRAQVIVHAEAHGSGYEGHLLAPLLDGTREAFHALDGGKDILARVKINADSGLHSKAVLAAVEAIGADAYVADRGYRKREPAFADAVRHKERHRKERALKRRREREARAEKKVGLFTLKDFQYDAESATCVCPAGHNLYGSGQDMLRSGYRVAHFKAPISACRGCHVRSQRLRHPARKPQRTLMVIKHRACEPEYGLRVSLSKGNGTVL